MERQARESPKKRGEGEQEREKSLKAVKFLTVIFNTTLK